MEKVIIWLESHLLACPTKSLTGADCFGCGMQRAVIHLLRGEWKEALVTYPALLPLLLTVALLFVHLVFKKSWSLAVLKYVYITTVCFIIINFISKFAL